MYTSGSTGKPKGVMVEHQNVTSFFKGMELAIELGPDGVWLAGTSISFDISVLEILGSLCYGRRVALLGESVLGQVENPRYTIPALVERHRVTHFQCTPSQARVLLLDDAGRRALASLEMLMLGGEALPADLAEELLSLVSGEVVNLYGPTETTVWSCAARVRPGEIVTIGKPIANTAVFILDERGALAPPGSPGELYIARTRRHAGLLRPSGAHRRALRREPREPGARARACTAPAIWCASRPTGASSTSGATTIR